ncbi:hypothetical protein [Pseudomonas chlororaphis]|uniref:hypothetical protein n=1 Tax=Pseudomonas chlororaphis TaxID=587753 RepID=UPI001B3089F9|nr:hypothetical protein [Pseudomonas chlororaphis]MBP5059205.1 hypothetical protein [Pseudomonas chlororaphis]MBP5142978.1 hypothetical protein [Pseudomonas chlororaphis]QTT97745.1 hypothetical protein HUT26_03015 [Pseudomonas chlororaphis]
MSKDKHSINDALLDQLLANYQKPEDLIGATASTKKLVECTLNAEMPQKGFFTESRGTEKQERRFV